MKDLHPGLHGRVCDFMVTPPLNKSGANHKLLQLARAHLKSYIASLGYNHWRATRFLEGVDTDWCTDGQSNIGDVLDLLIVMSTAMNAMKKSGQLADELHDRSDVYTWLFPGIVKGPTWNKMTRQLDKLGPDGRVVRRATIDFIGVGGRASSRHARGLTLDDMHAVEEAEESPPSVEDVVRYYKHTDPLLLEPGRDFIHVIGTDCSINPPDVYQYIKTTERDNYDIMSLGCYGEDGKPLWPERFPVHVLEAIRRKQGDEVFSRDYLNNPIDASVVEFRSKDLVRYHRVAGDMADPMYILDNGRRYRLSQMYTSMTIDLAGWRGEGDDNAIMVCGTTEDEMHLILYSWKLRCDPDTLINKIVDVHKEFYVPVAGVEEVAYQECLSFYLEKRINADHLAFYVHPCKPRGINKDIRIRGIGPLAREHRIAVADDDVIFLEEWTRFPKGKKHLLDCLAYQPLVWQAPMSEKLESIENRMQSDYQRSLGMTAA